MTKEEFDLLKSGDKIMIREDIRSCGIDRNGLVYGIYNHPGDILTVRGTETESWRADPKYRIYVDENGYFYLPEWVILLCDELPDTIDFIFADAMGI